MKPDREIEALKPSRMLVERTEEQNSLGLISELSPEEILQRREATFRRLRLLWQNRGRLLRALAISFALGVALALLIPARYETVERLMPPDGQGTGQAILAALIGGRTGSSSAGGLGALAGDFLGVKNSGALFVGILSSRTVQDRLIEQFGLMQLYGTKKIEDTR